MNTTTLWTVRRLAALVALLAALAGSLAVEPRHALADDLLPTATAPAVTSDATITPTAEPILVPELSPTAEPTLAPTVAPTPDPKLPDPLSTWSTNPLP